MCSSVLWTEVTQPDRSSVTSVLGQFGPQKRTEVTEDRSNQGPKWMYPLVSVLFSYCSNVSVAWVSNIDTSTGIETKLRPRRENHISSVSRQDKCSKVLVQARLRQTGFLQSHRATRAAYTTQSQHNTVTRSNV